MTADPLTRIVNAPRRARQAIALGLFMLAITIFAGTVWLATSSIRQARFDVQEKREMLGRLQAIAALKPALLKEDQIAAGNKSDFLEGESEAVVRGNLQAQLNAIFSAQNANLLSIGNTPDLDIDGARYIGIRADLSGTVEAIHNSILAVETSRALLINQASIWQSGPVQGAGAAQPPEISAQIHIYGALSPSFQARAAGAAP